MTQKKHYKKSRWNQNTPKKIDVSSQKVAAANEKTQYRVIFGTANP
jgi:hypothetical protein